MSSLVNQLVSQEAGAPTTVAAEQQYVTQYYQDPATGQYYALAQTADGQYQYIAVDPGSLYQPGHHDGSQTSLQNGGVGASYATAAPSSGYTVDQGAGLQFGTVDIGYDYAAASLHHGQAYAASEPVADYSSLGYQPEASVHAQRQQQITTDTAVLSYAVATPHQPTGRATGAGASDTPAGPATPMATAADTHSSINESMLLAVESAADRERFARGQHAFTDLSAAIEARWPERTQRCAVLRIIGGLLAAAKPAHGLDRQSLLLSQVGQALRGMRAGGAACRGCTRACLQGGART